VNFLWVTVFIFILDQLTKRAVQSSLSLHQSKPIIQDFFHLTYVTNDGMAFGLSMPGGRKVLLVLSILLTIFIFWFLWQEREGHKLVRLGLALILAGAFGNLLDRILYGKVVDFLDFMIGDFHWYIFNIADSSVTIGMIVFIFHSVFIETRKVSAESEA
tara:strand:- start:699 stop:1175 length:477 start_codon:yes stop_codon:yes gene_type:complete